MSDNTHTLRGYDSETGLNWEIKLPAECAWAQLHDLDMRAVREILSDLKTKIEKDAANVR